MARTRTKTFATCYKMAPGLTVGNRYDAIGITADRTKLLVINDENEKQWYNKSIFENGQAKPDTWAGT